MTQSHAKTVWVLTDGRAGHRTQALGLAQALPYPFDEKPLEFTALSALPNHLLPRSRYRLSAATRQQLSETPPPDIAISAGRKTAPALRYLKRKYPQCFTVYLMDPATGYADFDLVVPPLHDGPSAKLSTKNNICPTLGAINALTAEALAEASAKWHDTLHPLAAPRIALLAGGNSKSANFTQRDYHELGVLASELAGSGSLMVTTSPRSSAAQCNYLRLALSADFYWHDWNQPNEAKGNPYLAFLAHSDAVIVTGDSISMASEACSLGKPVYVFLPREGTLHPKLHRFHKSLFEQQLARPLVAGAALDWQPLKPLNEAERVAAEVVRRIG